MVNIQKFQFNSGVVEQIKNLIHGKNWPIVYLIENGSEIYVGQTVHAYKRSKDHLANPERQRLNQIHIIFDEEYNISATLDIESLLIQYLAADGSYILQNSNKGLIDHNYFDKQKYLAKFELIWKQLKENKFVKNDLVQIKNSDLFKFSPYKALTQDQLIVVEQLIKEIIDGKTNTYIVNGGPGTGKTVLASYLFKALKENKQTANLEIALVVPMTALRQTLQTVFRNIKGLKSNMVIGPNDVTKKKYDILLVDEAHRLSQRKNIANYQSFDKTNELLGLGKEGTQLDWVVQSSRMRVLFYDQNQSVRPSDVHPKMFQLANAKSFMLENQLRIDSGKEGNDYIDFIRDLFDLKDVHTYKFESYDFKIYDDINHFVADIKTLDVQFGLCRLVAGFAWEWGSRNNPEKHDIEIEDVKLFWNSVNQNWVNSKNAVNEVGCIHTVQGYDLNYTGVIIGPEFSYDFDSKKFIVNSQNYKDMNGRRGIDDPKELERYIINIYKTLMTRGILGTYLYICDANLRKYFKSVIHKELAHQST